MRPHPDFAFPSLGELELAHKQGVVFEEYFFVNYLMFDDAEILKSFLAKYPEEKTQRRVLRALEYSVNIAVLSGILKPGGCIISFRGTYSRDGYALLILTQC